MASLLNFTLQCFILVLKWRQVIFNEANLIDRVIIDTDPCQSKHAAHNKSFLFGSRVNSTPGSVTREICISARILNWSRCETISCGYIKTVYEARDFEQSAIKIPILQKTTLNVLNIISDQQYRVDMTFTLFQITQILAPLLLFFKI